jgi:hypothetical protein
MDYRKSFVLAVLGLAPGCFTITTSQTNPPQSSSSKAQAAEAPKLIPGSAPEHTQCVAGQDLDANERRTRKGMWDRIASAYERNDYEGGTGALSVCVWSRPYVTECKAWDAGATVMHADTCGLVLENALASVQRELAANKRPKLGSQGEELWKWSAAGKRFHPSLARFELATLDRPKDKELVAKAKAVELEAKEYVHARDLVSKLGDSCADLDALTKASRELQTPRVADMLRQEADSRRSRQVEAEKANFEANDAMARQMVERGTLEHSKAEFDRAQQAATTLECLDPAGVADRKLALDSLAHLIANPPKPEVEVEIESPQDLGSRSKAESRPSTGNQADRVRAMHRAGNNVEHDRGSAQHQSRAPVRQHERRSRAGAAAMPPASREGG